MSKDYWYFAKLNPVPWTSPSVSVGRKNGKPFPMVFSAAELKTYKEALADEIESNYPDIELIEDEIGLEFFFWRKLDKLEKGKKRKSRGHIADATNLQKSTEDALQGVLFKNDSQVVSAHSWVMEQHDEVDPLVVIHLVWHPKRPSLPEHVTIAIDDRQDSLFDEVEANAVDIDIEELF